jgi:two-component system phosphate regulon response regulator PhoB
VALNPTVLVVDDDFSALSLVGVMLERDGMIPLMASDAHEALAALSTATPDVIILDLIMPGIDGIRLATILRQRADTAKTPILMLTAPHDSESVKRAMLAGATDHLVRPVLYPNLIAKVRELLRQAPAL